MKNAMSASGYLSFGLVALSLGATACTEGSAPADDAANDNTAPALEGGAATGTDN